MLNCFMTGSAHGPCELLLHGKPAAAKTVPLQRAVRPVTTSRRGELITSCGVDCHCCTRRAPGKGNRADFLELRGRHRLRPEDFKQQ
jgi:hypothetical protein